MTRPLRYILAVLVGVLLLAGLYQVTHRLRANHPSTTLPDGSVLTVEGLTWGTNQTLLLEPELWSQLKDKLPQQLRNLVGPRQRPRTLNGDPSAHLWLTRRDPKSGAYLAMTSLDLVSIGSDGQELRSAGSHGFGSTGRADRCYRFQVLDWRAESLQFRFIQGSSTQVLSLPNPRRGETFPLWKPGALPQTRTVGGFSFALTGLKRVPANRGRWTPQLTLTRDGQDVSGWFSIDQTFSDPTGNLSWSALPSSEPVWRVNFTAYPAAAYPFPEGMAYRVGRVSLPEKGQFVTLSVGGEPTNACLQWAALTGAGSFGFRDGTNWLAQTPGKESAGNSSSISDSSWTVTTASDRPQLHLLLRGPISGGRLLPAPENRLGRILVRPRAADGTFLNASAQGYSSSHNGKTLSMMLEYEFDLAAVGQSVDLDLFLVEPLSVDFTIAAPPSP